MKRRSLSKVVEALVADVGEVPLAVLEGLVKDDARASEYEAWKDQWFKQNVRSALLSVRDADGLPVYSSVGSGVYKQWSMFDRDEFLVVIDGYAKRSNANRKALVKLVDRFNQKFGESLTVEEVLRDVS